MRIIAGKNRSLPLKTPKGLLTRPTTDRIKETLFNMISPKLPGAKFLDIFSGSGAIGLEAISRGAQKAYFIENNKEAIACIKHNISFTKSDNDCILYATDLVRGMKQVESQGHMDLIFMDPPYGMEYEKKVLEYLSESSLCNEDTLIIVEADLDTAFDYLEPLGFEIEKYKKYKTNAHIFIYKKNIEGQ